MLTNIKKKEIKKTEKPNKKIINTIVPIYYDSGDKSTNYIYIYILRFIFYNYM